MPSQCLCDNGLEDLEMTNRWNLLIATAVIPLVLYFSFLPMSMAQLQQLRDDIEQLAVDLHAGMDRSTLTEQQKAQLRDDFRELMRAHQNHRDVRYDARSAEYPDGVG